MRGETRAGVLSHLIFAAHSLHSAESPTAPTVEMDLLPVAPGITALVASAAATLGPSGEQQGGSTSPSVKALPSRTAPLRGWAKVYKGLVVFKLKKKKKCRAKVG